MERKVNLYLSLMYIFLYNIKEKKIILFFIILKFRSKFLF